jgi:hypothetical protein
MSKKACLVQLRSGDAVSGIVSRRMWPFGHLKVELPFFHDAATQETTKGDGIFWIPKGNVLFVQQMVIVAPTTLPQAGSVTLPGPTLTSEGRSTSAHVDAQRAQ